MAERSAYLLICAHYSTLQFPKVHASNHEKSGMDHSRHLNLLYRSKHHKIKKEIPCRVLFYDTTESDGIACIGTWVSTSFPGLVRTSLLGPKDSFAERSEQKWIKHTAYTLRQLAAGCPWDIQSSKRCSWWLRCCPGDATGPKRGMSKEIWSIIWFGLSPQPHPAKAENRYYRKYDTNRMW